MHYTTKATLFVTVLIIESFTLLGVHGQTVAEVPPITQNVVEVPSITGGVTGSDSHLQVAMVQFAVSPERYEDIETFRRVIDRFVATAQHNGADLVVFPEYINVFPLFEEYSDLIADSENLGDVYSVVDEEGSLAAFVRREVHEDADAIEALWAGVAKRHRVWILSGTAFVPGPSGGVRNRAWLFSPSGSLVYRQDKVFLTPFERDKLSLVPGTVSATESFEIKGVEFGLTICRDTYFDEWESHYRSIDVWIDIRANGERWNQGVRRRFDTALPERVADVPAAIGLSTSLNGNFLDLLWQGPAFVVDSKGTRVFQSRIVDGDAITLISVP